MNMRRDPIRVLAQVLPAIYAAAAEQGEHARCTVGFYRDPARLAQYRAGLLRFHGGRTPSGRRPLPGAEERRSRHHVLKAWSTKV